MRTIIYTAKHYCFYKYLFLKKMTETNTQLSKNNQSNTNATVIHRELNDSKENILDFESKLNENNQNISDKNALTSKLESLTLKSTKIQTNIEANNDIMNALNTDIKKLSEAKVEPNPIKNYKISVSLSTLMKDDISVVISYFKTLPSITDKELNGLESLYKHIINDEASKELANELFLEDIVMTYFSTLHPTNPTPINSWKRLTTLLKKKPFKDVNMDDVKAFLKGGLISFGYDKQEYPIWFIQSQNYNENQPVNAMSYAVRIWIYSIFCDRNKNSFDLKQMRRGLHYYTDMKAWSLRLISWKVLIALRDCQYGVPYGIVC